MPGVRKFKSSDDELRYITYMFEGYRGKKSNILTNFNEKYPPQELNYKEKLTLNKFIKKNGNDDYKEFLFSIQILIDYIQKTGKNQNMSLSEIIRNMPENININENIKMFFGHLDIQINKLVRIFELFEYLCWEQIKENLIDKFKKQINDDKQKLIDNYFKTNNFFKRTELASSIRKFISRYLIGNRNQSEINEDKMLFDYLNRIDLWERNIKEPNFDKNYLFLSELKITVGEAYNFYDILGGDKQSLDLNVEENKANRKNKIFNDHIQKDNDNRNRIIINNEEEEEEEEINTCSKNKSKYKYENIDEEDDEEKIDNEPSQKKSQRRKLF